MGFKYWQIESVFWMEITWFYNNNNMRNMNLINGQ